MKTLEARGKVDLTSEGQRHSFLSDRPLSLPNAAFQAYHQAKYINEIAAAAKRVQHTALALPGNFWM